ncbi:MAG: hypothetical protein HOQ24_15360, partial [Mycobacteriaceae bacterium]|nr:hypothetical protein [Mycobacteriaceae bacterium]
VAAEGVLQRWHPDGMDMLRRLRIADPDRPTVALYRPGADLADNAQLVEELCRLEPKVQFVTSPLEAVVVVMLLDAAAPLGRTELTGIGELLTTGSRPVYALTGVEAHREWRVVRDRNAQLLSGFAKDAGDLRIWPVSARLAALSRQVPAGAGDPGMVFAGSGVTRLHSAILSALPIDPGRERAGHLERATATVIKQTVDRIGAEADRLRSEDAALEQLRADRTRLTARRDGGRAEAMASLRAHVQLARVDLLHDVGVRVRALNAELREEIDRMDPADLATAPQQLRDRVQQLTADVDREVWDRVDAVRESAMPTEAPQLAGTVRTPAPQVGPDPRPRHRGLEDRLMIVFGASAAVGLGRLAVAPLSLVPALDIASVPIALLLGGGAAWWLLHTRRHLADRGHLRQWVADTLVNVKAQLEQRVVATLVETESLLTEQLMRTGTERAVAVDHQIAEITAKIRDATSKRTGKLSACERDLTVLDTVTPR